METRVIKPNGIELPAYPHLNSGEFNLTDLQLIVGGYVEIIRLSDEFLMVINEEGKLKELKLNERATDIYREYLSWSDDFIVGTVLICKSSEVS